MFRFFQMFDQRTIFQVLFLRGSLFDFFGLFLFLNAYQYHLAIFGGRINWFVPSNFFFFTSVPLKLVNPRRNAKFTQES